MDKINPFDNLYFKKGLEQTQSVNAPQKINEQNSPLKPEENQGIKELLNKNEDEFVDMSLMTDDFDDLGTSDFDFNEDNENFQTGNLETKNGDKQNQNNHNEDEIKEEVNQFINDLLEKKN